MELLELILGGMFSLIAGAYWYIYLSVSRLWRAIDNIRDNDIEHIKARLNVVEQDHLYLFRLEKH